MINKLKRKFLLIGTVFMFILMTVLVLIMNIVNYREVVADADSVLDVLSQPNLPLFAKNQLPVPDGFIPRGMSPEVPYESRFFIAIVSSDGEVINSDLSRIVSVDDVLAKDYTDGAMKSKSERGFIGSFRFLKTSDETGTRILFLDCGRKLESFMSFLWISVIVGFGGCVVVFLAFVFTAGKIVAPIAESYEKQKRFISDAGHEIKTPLTIINANVDLLEIDGEKEELSEIRTQTKRLTELTNNLILLSKMEESEHTLKMIEFPLSDLVNETANSFRAIAVSRDIDFTSNIEAGITAKGSPDAIRQLMTILLDNAIKYSASGGKVTLEMKTHKKTAVISVCNLTDENLTEKDIEHLFDRFYRADASRNSETGGHGIGLSIAKAITEAHGGKINAAMKEGNVFGVTIVLPI